MKKFKIAALLLTVLTAAGAMSGCGGADNGGEGITAADTGIYTVNEFDSLADLQNLIIPDIFGKISVNRDEQYITSGSGSARIEAHGDPYGQHHTQPLFRMFTHSDYNLYNKGKIDFSDVSYFCFDVFNAGDRDSYIAFGYKEDLRSRQTYRYSPRYQYKVSMGRWTTITVPFNTAAISAFDITNIAEFTFAFPQRAAGETPLVYYLDNFIAKKADGEAVFTKTLTGESSLLSFESFDEILALRSNNNDSAYPERTLCYSLNRAPDYITDGNYSLKVSNWKDNATGVLREVILPAAILDGYTDLTAAESLSFDIFNTSNIMQEPLVKITYGTAEGSKTEIIYITVGSGSWSNITVSLAALKAKAELNDVRSIAVGWHGNDSYYDVYLDNFRIQEEV